jgi:hypothetical protein
MTLAELITSSSTEGARFDSAAGTLDLQKHCLGYGWPQEIVNNLSFVNDGSKEYVYFPPYLAPRIKDLEFGTQDSPPTGVLRKFLDTRNEGAYVEGMLATLFKVGGNS